MGRNSSEGSREIMGLRANHVNEESEILRAEISAERMQNFPGLLVYSECKHQISSTMLCEARVLRGGAAAHKFNGIAFASWVQR